MLATRRLLQSFSVKAYDPNKNYYQVLSVPQHSTTLEIKQAFRTLAKQCHPDTIKGKQELFKQINQAYQVLSDSNVKAQYDQVRTAQQRSQTQSTSRGPQQTSQHGYQQQNTYRGYQPEEGWKNKNIREQFMYDLYRQQQNQKMRGQYQQSQQQKMERMFRESVQQAIRRDPKEHIRKYSEQVKERQAQMRRQFQQQQRVRMQKEYEHYRRYRDETYSDMNEKLKNKLNKAAQNIANNVKDAMNVGQQLRSLWSKFKENNRK